MRGAQGVGMRAALLVEEGAKPPLQSGEVLPEPDYEIRALAEIVNIVKR